MSADLIELVQQLGQPRVLVVGDVILDRYVWGDAERVSQEAPVLLLHADKREERLGGARRAATTRRGWSHPTDPPPSRSATSAGLSTVIRSRCCASTSRRAMPSWRRLKP